MLSRVASAKALVCMRHLRSAGVSPRSAGPGDRPGFGASEVSEVRDATADGLSFGSDKQPWRDEGNSPTPNGHSARIEGNENNKNGITSGNCQVQNHILNQDFARSAAGGGQGPTKPGGSPQSETTNTGILGEKTITGNIADNNSSRLLPKINIVIGERS